MLDDVSDDKRAAGVVDEMAFWRTFVHDKEFAPFFGPGPNRHLQPEVDQIIKDIAAAQSRPIHVLDLGSGVASILSHNFDKERVIVTAGDPLANQYAELMRDHPMRGRYVAPVEAEGERLAATFGAHAFDIVHIRNALDHVANPLMTLYSMVTVLRPGGYIMVHGFENEASNAHWVGFHQWNLSITNGRFVIEGANRKPIVVEEFFKGTLAPVRQWNSTLYNRAWMNFVARVS